MVDVTLANGWELVFDLSKITISEFRSMLDPTHSEREGDELLARCAGLTAEQVDEIGALPYTEYRRMTQAFYRKAREPLADPNSPSASTKG